VIVAPMGWTAVSWVYGVLAGSCALRYGVPGGIDLGDGPWTSSSHGFRPWALLLVAVGPACASFVGRLEPRATRPRVVGRLDTGDLHSALAVGLIAAAIVRWTCLEAIAGLPAPGGTVGALRALASVAFGGAVAWLCIASFSRLPAWIDVHALAALGGTASVFLLQRGDSSFFYGSIF
jgi:hypothetical protein